MLLLIGTEQSKQAIWEPWVSKPRRWHQDDLSCSGSISPSTNELLFQTVTSSQQHLWLELLPVFFPTRYTYIYIYKYVQILLVLGAGPVPPPSRNCCTLLATHHP
eukprot:5455720-Amphidinium_carterae.1